MLVMTTVLLISPSPLPFHFERQQDITVLTPGAVYAGDCKHVSTEGTTHQHPDAALRLSGAVLPSPRRPAPSWQW